MRKTEELFAAQLAWTLRQLPIVRLIAITVEGAPVKIEGVDGEFRVDAFAGFDPAGIAGDRRLYALSRAGLVSVESTDVAAVPGPIGEVRGSRSAAVDPSGQLGALVADDGRSVTVGGMTSSSEQTPTTWLDGARSLLRPSWDQHGLLWLVDRTSKDGGARILAGPEGRVREVDAPGLTGEDVESFAVSSDGVRAAAIVRVGDTPRLVVSVIDRSPDNSAAVTLREPRVVRPAEFTLSAMSVACVGEPDVGGCCWGTSRAQDTGPYTIAIDGSAIEAAGGTLPAPPTALAAGRNEDGPIVVGDGDGRIYGLSPELRWERLGGAPRLWAPVYPG